MLNLMAVLTCRRYNPDNHEAETVHLSAAASMTDALKEIITGFTAAHPAAQGQQAVLITDFELYPIRQVLRFSSSMSTDSFSA
jgi:hypothetical protein